MKVVDQKLADALTSLRPHPGFKVVVDHLRSELESVKDNLVTNQNPVAVPTQQGRAQQLREILNLFEGKK